MYNVGYWKSLKITFKPKEGHWMNNPIVVASNLFAF